MVPPLGHCLRGDAPSEVSLAATWTTLSDHTYYAAVRHKQGWLIAHPTSSLGSSADLQQFANGTDAGAAISFRVSRGTTYLSVRVDYTESLAVLVGVIFGYLGSVMGAFGMVMRWIEGIRQRVHGDKRPYEVERYEHHFEMRNLSSSESAHKQFHKSQVVIN